MAISSACSKTYLENLCEGLTGVYLLTFIHQRTGANVKTKTTN
jgi:hypothetical protein